MFYTYNRAVATLLLSAVLFPAGMAYADLTLTNELVFWLKADSVSGFNDGDLMTSWIDSSTNNLVMTSEGTSRPTFKTNILNGQPIVRFLDSPSRMGTSTVQGARVFSSNEFSMYFVLSEVGTNDFNRVFNWSQGLGTNLVDVHLAWTGDELLADHGDRDNGGRMKVAQPADWAANFHMVEMFRSGALGEIGVDTTNLFSSNNIYTDELDALNLNAFLSVGNNTPGSAGFVGDIAELLIYKTALSAAERQTVLQYLDDKYAFGLIAGVPEPGEMSLLVVCGLGLAYWYRKRRKFAEGQGKRRPL